MSVHILMFRQALGAYSGSAHCRYATSLALLEVQMDFTFTPALNDLLRATAVPAGTAEVRISYGNSVCPSVRLDPVRIQGQLR